MPPGETSASQASDKRLTCNKAPVSTRRKGRRCNN
jgi:hypothetical protein